MAHNELENIKENVTQEGENKVLIEPLQLSNIVINNFFQYKIDSQLEILRCLYLDTKSGNMIESNFDFDETFTNYYLFLSRMDDLTNSFDNLSSAEKTTIRTLFLFKLKEYLTSHNEKNESSKRITMLEMKLGINEIKRYIPESYNATGAPYSFVQIYNDMSIQDKYKFICKFTNTYIDLFDIYLDTLQIRDLVEDTNDNIIVKLLGDEVESEKIYINNTNNYLLKDYYNQLYPYEKAQMMDEVLDYLYIDENLIINSSICSKLRKSIILGK